MSTSGKTLTTHGKPALLQLYKRLLRAAEDFPSIKRAEIYQSIRDEFRLNKEMDPKDEKTKIQIAVAYKGLSQLRQFDVDEMTGGKGEDADWEINLEQNPMPKPSPKLK